MRLRTATVFPWLIPVAVALIGLNLRGPVVAVAPVARLIGGDLGLDSAQAGLLTSLPILCFALATPLASLLITHGGRDLAATVTLAGVILGTIVRSADGVVTAFAGTLVLGAFLTVGNVVIPLIIAEEVPSRHASMATGAYTASLNVGSIITSLGTAPLAEAFGWRAALAAWALLALVAAGVWIFAVGPKAALRPARARSAGLARSALRPPARRSAVLALGFAFGAQAFAFYGTTAWLPRIFADDHGYTAAQAGSASSVFQLLGVVGALALPLLVRWAGERFAILTVAVLWLSLPAGLQLAPDLWPVWLFTGGLAQGGGISMMFLLVVALAQAASGAGAVSASVQGIGYAIAAAAPAALGALRDGTGGWAVPLLAIAVAVIAAAVLALLSIAARG